MHRFSWMCAVTAMVLGCAGENGATPSGDCASGAAAACTCPSGVPSQCGPAGCQCTPATGGADTVPCDVQTVLQAHCWSCHGTEPKFTAPMMVAASAFRAASHKDPSKTVGALAAIRVQDPSQKMPPAPAPELTPAEIAVLQSWANSGSPAGTACQVPSGTGGAGPVGAGGAPVKGAGGAVPGGSGGVPTGGAGGTMPIGSGGVPPGAGGTMVGVGGTPVGTGGTTPGSGGAPVVDPSVTCYKIVARQTKGGAEFAVPTTPDYYAVFSYAPPWGSKRVHVIETRSIIDNDKVIHHWLLYNNTRTVTDGAVSQSVGAHPDASLVVGWAPGNEPLPLPADVGLAVPGQGFTLEVHYNNSIGQGQTDGSGVEVCVTDKLRPKEAQVSWLGTQSLSKLTASGTCKPKLTAPVTVLFSWPHEHLQGRHLKTVINRAGGAQEVLVDKAFDFNAQLVYSTPAVINPGDSLTTTCTYAQPTPFGQGTNAEMCYNFVTAYPGGALTNGSSFLRINDCTADQ